MLSRRTVVLMLAATLLAQPAVAADSPANPVKMFDADNDGTLDLAEVKRCLQSSIAIMTVRSTGANWRAS